MIGGGKKADCASHSMVPGEGLEPSRSCDHKILSLACIPFHHPGGNRFYCNENFKNEKRQLTWPDSLSNGLPLTVNSKLYTIRT